MSVVEIKIGITDKQDKEENLDHVPEVSVIGKNEEEKNTGFVKKICRCVCKG